MGTFRGGRRRRAQGVRRFITGALAALSGLFVWTLSGGARAQVNAEMLQQNLLKDGIGTDLRTSIMLATGNVVRLDVAASWRVQYQTLYPLREGEPKEIPFIRQRTFIVGNAEYAESNDKAFMSQSYFHARWTAMWHRRIGTDVFAQHQYNRFFRLERRSLLGAGVRVDIIHTPHFLWWGGTAYMLEYEKIAVQPGASDLPETLSHRWTSYMTARLSFFDGKLLVQSTTYIQPRFDDFSDYRILEDLEGVGKITDVFGYGLSLSVLHDSMPPTGILTTDVRMSTNVRVTY